MFTVQKKMQNAIVIWEGCRAMQVKYRENKRDKPTLLGRLRRWQFKEFLFPPSPPLPDTLASLNKKTNNNK